MNKEKLLIFFKSALFLTVVMFGIFYGYGHLDDLSSGKLILLFIIWTFAVTPMYFYVKSNSVKNGKLVETPNKKINKDT
jgi:uncharacterized protein (DUF486 family)